MHSIVKSYSYALAFKEGNGQLKTTSPHFHCQIDVYFFVKYMSVCIFSLKNLQ